MASITTGQFILERLADWGVRRVYGYPGDGINGLMGAFHHVGDRIRWASAIRESASASVPNRGSMSQ